MMQLLNVYIIILLENCKDTNNPYGIGNTGYKIANFLSELNLNKQLLQKNDHKGIRKIASIDNKKIVLKLIRKI